VESRPTLYRTWGTWQPMKRYDEYVGQGDLAWSWEYNNHRTTNPDDWWSGHCHGWAVASYMEIEPSTGEGREPFTIGDQKGLLIECYYDTDLHATR
ncbi:MAG: hypothetical protein ACE5OR_14295, partial [bacterium]